MSLLPNTFTFYGDDFTGSTDSLDMLARHGVSSILVPERAIDKLSDFTSYDVVGIAGQARSMTPDKMKAHLPHVFAALHQAGRTVLHYKVCSTFDSAPGIGNIAVAASIAMESYGQQLSPVLGGAPALARYCLFGNLFAAYRDPQDIYRIDRHPVMRNHPVTPMREGDLREHFRMLDPQSLIEDLNLISLRAGSETLQRTLAEKPMKTRGFMIVDALEIADTDVFAQLVLEPSEAFLPTVLIGGSSIEDAFGRCWRNLAHKTKTTYKPVEQLLVLSASCSPTSAAQIEHARACGFKSLTVDTSALLLEVPKEQERLVTEVTAGLRLGKSIVVHTCLGNNDPRISTVRDMCKTAGMSSSTLSEQIGQALSSVLVKVLKDHPLPRIALAGGDFSSVVVNSLAIDALAFRARVAPGAPLCTIKSSETLLDGVEIALKGGQLGQIDYYERLLMGMALGETS